MSKEPGTAAEEGNSPFSKSHSKPALWGVIERGFKGRALIKNFQKKLNIPLHLTTSKHCRFFLRNISKTSTCKIHIVRIFNQALFSSPVIDLHHTFPLLVPTSLAQTYATCFHFHGLCNAILSLAINSYTNIPCGNYFFKCLSSLRATHAQQAQEANTLL